jgi:hypothetical protein
VRIAASFAELFCKLNNNPISDRIIKGEIKNGAIAKGNINPDSKAINRGWALSVRMRNILILVIKNKKESAWLSFSIT